MTSSNKSSLELGVSAVFDWFQNDTMTVCILLHLVGVGEDSLKIGLHLLSTRCKRAFRIWFSIRP